MKKVVFTALALACLVGVSGSARAETYFGFNIGISNAPPPPVVVYRSPPHVVYVPETRVYVVDQSYGGDYDMFRYGDVWYVYDDGYWYRGRSYRGPYRVVDVRYVPQRILTVPRGRWHHHPHGGPPGQMKKYARRDVRYVGRSRVEYVERGSDKGHGNGKDKGRGHGHDKD